jgi:hypothetical protein
MSDQNDFAMLEQIAVRLNDSQIAIPRGGKRSCWTRRDRPGAATLLGFRYDSADRRHGEP